MLKEKIFLLIILSVYSSLSNAETDSANYDRKLSFICHYRTPNSWFSVEKAFVLPKETNLDHKMLGYYRLSYEPIVLAGRFDEEKNRYFVTEDDMLTIHKMCIDYCDKKQKYLTGIFAYEKNQSSVFKQAPARVLDFDILTINYTPKFATLYDRVKHFGMTAYGWLSAKRKKMAKWLFGPQKRVFTIYFLGTGSNLDDAYSQKSRYWNGETVARLAKHYQEGEEFIDYLVLEGPGSGKRQYHERFEEFVGQAQPSVINELIFGAGALQNVRNALAALKLENQNPLKRDLVRSIRKVLAERELGDIDVVNIVGWSRGGVSAIVLANHMARDERLKGIEVNVFAIDPVPGPKWVEDVFSLQANVKHYVGLYAEDERSYGFEPVVPVRAINNEVTKIELHSFPGQHGTLTGNDHSSINHKNLKNCNLKDTGLLIFAMVHSFLSEKGTPLKIQQKLSHNDFLMHYNNIIQNMACYRALKDFSYTVNLKKHRVVLQGIGNNKYKELPYHEVFTSPEGFVNFHHEKLHKLSLSSAKN